MKKKGSLFPDSTSFLRTVAMLAAVMLLSWSGLLRAQPIIQTFRESEWGTNFVMWFDEDMQFRFTIRG